jgi:transcriptional/translational regulatory protein YebC/TACO1
MTPVGFMFERKGLISLELNQGGGTEFDELYETAVEEGAEDVIDTAGQEGAPDEVEVRRIT